MDFLHDATLYLAAAVLAVSVFRRLGLGSVLGYLTAGILIGPDALGLVEDPQRILHFAEIGVVFLLFVIGLELRPARLWILRRSVFGLGGLQLATAALAITLLAVAAGFDAPNATVIGLSLGLSSTAFVLQMLGEKGDLASPYGRASFGVLLFQDLAVIPILAILPILGASPDPTDATAPWWRPIAILGALGVFVAVGRYLLRPALRFVAYSRVHEIFIAAALLLVLASALVMEVLGISMALGAFTAGVLLADSEYRHELEAAIDPFKGLLLGLFFLAVGMTLDLDLFVAEPEIALGLALLLMLVKTVLLFGVGRAMGVAAGPARRMALILSQGGEFAFVILTESLDFGLLGDEAVRMLVLVVTLSMALTPFLTLLDERLLSPRLDREDEGPVDEPAPEANDVIIAGFGRSGQVVARILKAKGIEFTALERDPSHLDFVRRFGSTVYFGDAASLEILRAAGASRAKILVIAVNNAEESLRIVHMARRHFPHLALYAAARNRRHALALRECGIEFVIRITFASSLELSEAVLRGLGATPEDAAHTIRVFREHDEETLDRQFEFHTDDDALIQSSRDAEEELRLLLESDEPIDDESDDPA